MAEPMTLRDIADAEGISHQAVEQILKRAFGKFRKALYQRGLTEFSKLSIDEVFEMARVRKAR